MSNIDLKALPSGGKRMRIDLSGQVFGRLTAVEFAGINGKSRASCHCLCTCGNQVIVTSIHLRTGNTQSCGCLRAERASAAAKETGRRAKGQRQALLDRLESAERRAEEAEKERDALRKDAARWIFVASKAELESFGGDSYCLPYICAWDYKPGPQLNEQFSSLEAAIDAAMAQEGGK